MISLEEAQNNLKQFLEKYPEMQSYQDEIDNILSKCTGTNTRLDAIMIMIGDRLHELNNVVSDLDSHIRYVSNVTK